MRRVWRAMGYLVLVLICGIVLLWAFGPREPVDLTPRFTASTVGDDPDRYYADSEARFDDITPGSAKSILWATEPGTRSETVLVYVHGFSATANEIRPVPERLSAALGANVVFTRLAGHGRTGPAMAEAAVADWVHDLDEALAVADLVGDRIVVIATSTGATLTAAALTAGRDALIDAVVFLSPNFRISNPASGVLTLPAARFWVPPLFGADRGFEAMNEDHAAMWTTSYPTTALLPMAALVQHAQAADYSGVETPALFLFSPDDTVVSPEATREIAARWGGPVTVAEQTMGEGDDPSSHVIAGDALSPSRTGPVTDEILGWLSGL